MAKTNRLMRVSKEIQFNIKSDKGFRELFDEFYPSMYNYARRIVENEEAADDITQEVFINLWNKRNELEVHSFAGFLYTSTRHRCMNYIRGEKNRLNKQISISDTHTDEVDDHLFVVEEEMVREIKKLIATLPEQQQNVFKLHVSGLKQKEIAEELGISVNTVKTHKLKARQYLKAQLKDTLYLFLLVRF